MAFTFVTVAEVKNHIDETGTTWDTIIASLIDQCTQYAMNYCGGRCFIAPETDDTEYFDIEEFQKKIFLRNWPIQSITKVSFRSGTPYDNPVWEDYNPATDYVKNDRLGILQFQSLPKGVQNMKVVYKGGYANAANIPQDLKLIIIKIVAAEFNKRKSQGISSESIGGASISWEKHEDFKPILDNYRRFL